MMNRLHKGCLFFRKKLYIEKIYICRNFAVMAKTSGGTRNYTSNNTTLSRRIEEFNAILNSGDYDKKRSYLDESGGFVVVNNNHNNPQKIDMSEIAVKKLAKKGYKIYLEDERNFIIGKPSPDGRVYKEVMDVKTVNVVGKNTIKNQLENATKQGASVAILYQNNEKMTRSYVESQIELFNNKSPKRAKDKLKLVIVVGKNGNVHRHKIK